MESGEIVSGSAVQQMFAAQYDRLKNINIYITEGTIGEEFNFVLYDAAMGVIMQQVINTKDMKSIPGDCRVQVNIDTEVGQAYYFAVQGMESPFRTGFEETAASGNPYNGAAFYGGVEDREHSMIASYEYEIPLRKGRTLVWDALFVLSGIAVTYLTGIYYKKHPEKNTLVTVEKTVKVVCNPLIVLSAVGACVAVWPCRLFPPIQYPMCFLWRVFCCQQYFCSMRSTITERGSLRTGRLSPCWGRTGRITCSRLFLRGPSGPAVTI